MLFSEEPLKNWQKKYKTWPERMSFIKQKEGLADFKFIVGPEKTVFHAHKLIFAISSPEFENLFYLLGSDMKEICLPEISSDIFKEFLNFVYTGTVEITLENIGDLLKLSTLYDITLLTDKCDDYLQETISKDNVFRVLEISSELAAESKCLKIIGENSSELFQSAEFVKISKRSLEKIVEYEMLPCREIVLFEAVDKWAENAQLEAKSKNRRKHVHDLIPKIRFGSMSLEEFGKCAVGTILTSIEIADIVKYLASPITSNRFFFKKRLIQKNLDELPVQRCLRFDDCSVVIGYVDVNVDDSSFGLISEYPFTVNKYVYLFGYGIYGITPDALELYKTSKVGILIFDAKNYILSKKTEEITFDGTTRIYEIFFNSPVLLEPFKTYKVFTQKFNIPVQLINRKPSADILKVHRFLGKNGRTEIKENGVTFKITDLSTASVAALLFKN